MSRADTAAVLAKVATADPSTLARERRGNFDVWSATLPSGRPAVCVMPALKNGAPASVRRWARDRALANLTGRCPRCDAVTGAHPYRVAEMSHEDGCTLQDTSPVQRWIRREVGA